MQPPPPRPCALLPELPVTLRCPPAYLHSLISSPLSSCGLWADCEAWPEHVTPVADVEPTALRTWHGRVRICAHNADMRTRRHVHVLYNMHPVHVHGQRVHSRLCPSIRCCRGWGERAKSQRVRIGLLSTAKPAHTPPSFTLSSLTRSKWPAHWLRRTRLWSARMAP